MLASRQQNHLAHLRRPVHKEAIQRQKELDRLMKEQMQIKTTRIATLSRRNTALETSNTALQAKLKDLEMVLVKSRGHVAYWRKMYESTIEGASPPASIDTSELHCAATGCAYSGNLSSYGTVSIRDETVPTRVYDLSYPSVKLCRNRTDGMFE